jgi:hypothetical protein
MLAVLRHKDSLSRIVFPKPKMDSKRGPATNKPATSTYQPISATMPSFHSSEASKEWVQLLKIRMDRELSLTELF